MQRTVEGFANSTFFNLLCGDSVYIESFLRFAGVRIARSESTGSNFGTEQHYENPFLCAVGPGTVASDGLTLGNVTMSSHAFRLGACRIGANNFLGTDVFVPPNARTGDNCMLGTKVMAPIDGPVRENVGLLGSPCFEIPRAASRDVELVGRIGADERRSRMAEKTRHNVRTAAAMLAMHWLQEFIALYVLTATAALYGWRDLGAMSGAIALVVIAIAALHVLVERGSIGFKRLQPTIATTYDPAFWRIERYWKLSGAGSVSQLFAGTPFRPMMLRCLGVRVGRRVFDDGCNISERTLVEIGDGAMLNQGVMLQAHSLEEGVFKSDAIRIGADCALGVGAFVHYGVTMGEGARLDPDAFLMKGETAPAHSRWRGNPARLLGRKGRAAPVIPDAATAP
jgi:non-ribosomal peptide synthetase-like protein